MTIIDTHKVYQKKKNQFVISKIHPYSKICLEEKQKIADEAQAASTYFDEQRANRDE